eukprot:gene27120-29897_t
MLSIHIVWVRWRITSFLFVLRRIGLGLCLVALNMAAVRAQDLTNNEATPHTWPIRVELLANVAVHRAQVTLAEIAHISAANKQVLAHLKALPLGVVTRTGESVHLDRPMLAHWIRTRLGIENAEISWSGAEATVIHFAVSELAGEQIALYAKQSLATVIAQKNMRADIAMSQVPRDLMVPVGEMELKVRPFSDVSLMAKHQSAWVDIWIDGSFFRTVPVGLEVSVFAPAYVLTKNLSEGQPLDPTALTVREVEWSGHVSLPLPVAAEPAALP